MPKKIKVLVVDDIQENRRLLRKTLEWHGYTVEEAGNGAEALEMARKEMPGLIISDVLMPVMDGFQLCRTLKMDKELKGIPVIFYSATYSDRESQKLALALGAVAYIVKPIEPDELVRIIRDAVGKQKKPGEKPIEEKVYMKLYNERLVRKLEKKMLDLERSDKEVRHLNTILATILDVNRMIIKENNLPSLLQKTCDRMIEGSPYRAAWFGIMKEDGKGFAELAVAGFGGKSSRFLKEMIAGNLVPCVEKALKEDNGSLVMVREKDCDACPFKDAHPGGETLVICNRHADIPSMLLAVSSGAGLYANGEKKILINGISDSLLTGIHKMKLEEDRSLANDRIKRSLREKESLLAEIHHRVKNNMQIVSSLLSLQSKDIKDERALSLIKNCDDRIRAMSLVHEKLYLSEDLSHIDFSDYVESMAANLFQVHRVDSRVVTFSSQIKDALFNIETAIPLGLIINELISNALEHAFPEGKKGCIAVELTKGKKAGKYALTVTDDGIGFPEEIDYKNPETFGLQLVEMLTEQLHGTVELDRGKGTSFKIVFEERKYKKRI